MVTKTPMETRLTFDHLKYLHLERAIPEYEFVQI